MVGEGKLRFEIAWDGKRITGVSIGSSRPVLACRVLEGKPAAQAVARVPLLFSICGRAQAVAAAAALERAAGRQASAATARLRERTLAAECAQEHLWRFLIDLPALLGEPPLSDYFVPVRRRCEDLRARGAAGDARAWLTLADDLADFLEKQLLGMTPACFLELSDEEDIAAWLRAGRGLAASLLARLRDATPARDAACGVALFTLPSAVALSNDFAPAMAASDDFAAVPLLNGMPAESGALARQAEMPAIAAMLARRGRSAGLRVFARLVELARLPERMREADRPWLRAARDCAGAGLAAVETARGVLIHYVDLSPDPFPKERGDDCSQALPARSGRVSDLSPDPLSGVDDRGIRRYRIVAPTEWNFHPRGAFARGLMDIPAPDETAAGQAARLLAHALDPCVAYDLAVKRACAAPTND